MDITRSLRTTAIAAALAATAFTAGCGDGAEYSATITPAGQTPFTLDPTFSSPSGGVAQAVVDGFTAGDTCLSMGSRSTVLRVDVDDVEVGNDKAVARVVASGGAYEGVGGTVTLKRVDGAWKVDDLLPDLQRSLLRAGVRSGAPGKALVACLRSTPEGRKALRDPGALREV